MRFPASDGFQCRQAYNNGLYEKVLQKMYEQWGTMRKAFMALNHEKSGKITPGELKFYLNHWGMQVPDEEFE